jgi:hypothetical protein
VDGLAPDEANFAQRIANYTTVRSWISASAKTGMGRKSTRLIVGFDF